MLKAFHNVRRAVSKVFNWKKHPASVFIVTGPLAAIGFGATLLLSLLKARHEGDYVYLAIWFAGMTMLVIALIPVYRMHMLNRTLRELELERKPQ